LDLNSERDAQQMVQSIKGLQQQDKPSSRPIEKLLHGLEIVADRFGEIVDSEDSDSL